MKIKTKGKLLAKQICYGLLAIILLLAYFPNMASAAQITPRKVTLGSSLASASTTYKFTFQVPTTTTYLQSVSFAAYSAATCTGAVAGFSSASATLTNATTTNLGGTTWAVDNSNSAQLAVKETNSSNYPSGTQEVDFSNVTNPSASNTTFFICMTTYSGTSYTSPIDTGVVAASTAGQITVSGAVAETLTFTLATATVALGAITTGTTGSGTSSMTASTNGATGYSISYTGATLTSGTSTITALTAGGASSTNNSQFGINLRLNTTPAVGADKSGAGSGAYGTGYDTVNTFKFLTTGDVIATASAVTNSNTFTTSYIANISGATPAGSYSTVITYVATANF